jgi:hypothetical protein
MRKYSSEEKTKQLGIRVKKNICAEFYEAARRANYANIEGRFFEIVFKEWLGLKAGTALSEIDDNVPLTAKTRTVRKTEEK